MIPIIVIANYPALSLIGGLSFHFVILALAITFFFLLISRYIFFLGLRSYTSASS